MLYTALRCDTIEVHDVGVIVAVVVSVGEIGKTATPKCTLNELHKAPIEIYDTGDTVNAEKIAFKERTI